MAAGFAEGRFNRTDYIGIAIKAICNVLTDGFTRYGHAIGIDKAFLAEFVHNGVHTARLVKLLHISSAGRRKMA